jgi:methylenetetrahydrofolate reductase (NADPH)
VPVGDSVTNPQDIANPNLQAVRRAEAFARDWSVETTRPKPPEIEELRGILRAAAPVYISAVPNQSHDEQIETAARVRAQGLEPVPHLAARRHVDRAGVEKFLLGLRQKAEVRRLLVIGGDIDAPAGIFANALAVIGSGLLQAAGIEEIGIAGYPDGHPRIGQAELEQALMAKIEAAKEAGLRTHIVSQFCFEPARIIEWLLWLRRAGIGVPVKIGMVGPTSLTSLLNFARRCGVKTSTRGLMQRPGLLGTLVADAGPQPILDALLQAPAQLGDISPHFYSFGGLIKTARFGQTAAAHGFASGKH